MVVCKERKIAFGSGTSRDAKPTGHPGLNLMGLHGDPALYHPQSLQKIFEINKHRAHEPWQYKKELEEWSKNLGYRNHELVEQRRFQASLLGPAWTQITKEYKCEMTCKNVGFGRTHRITIDDDKGIPGPGTYYRRFPFKAPYGPHSTRPTLDREPACRFKPGRVSIVAPARYKIIDKESIEQKSKQITSLRGPYDLFTGKRDSTTIKNHFNTTQCGAKTWPLALPGCLEKYKKTNLGKMNKTGRNIPYKGRMALVDAAMSIRNPDEPGPANYNVDKPKVFKQNKCGFNSSYDQLPGYIHVIPWPGVGKYKPRAISCGIIGHGHCHVFKSKVARTIGGKIPKPMNSF